VDKASYVNNGAYLSASAKLISQVYKWYVDEVLYQVNKTYLGAAEMINEQIDNDFGESADNVCHPNPMFGHEWQVYQRRDEIIQDPATGEDIGFNTPITFSFSTGTFIAVPGGKIRDFLLFSGRS